MAAVRRHPPSLSRPKTWDSRVKPVYGPGIQKGIFSEGVYPLENHGKTMNYSDLMGFYSFFNGILLGFTLWLFNIAMV